jgi:osmotically-inducible protein OsmY
MIQQRELAAVLGADFNAEVSAEGPETAIKDAVHATLEELKWVPSPLIDVTVQGGNVTLRGTLLLEDEREPLRVAIETIPGVARYTDNLALADAADDIFPPEAGEVMRRQKLY